MAFTKLGALLRRAAAKSREALVNAMSEALDAISARDVRGFFGHCGYRTSVQSL